MAADASVTQLVAASQLMLQMHAQSEIELKGQWTKELYEDVSSSRQYQLITRV